MGSIPTGRTAEFKAQMLKLVDKHGLEPCAVRRGGSIPLLGTKMKNDKIEELNLGKMRAKTAPLAVGISLACITVFAGGGFLLDSYLDKKPLFFIIGFVVAFVVTDVLIFVFGKKIWKQSL